MQQNKDKAKDRYDQQNSHQHPLLHAGQQVHIQDEKTKLWEPRVVTQTIVGPRSYMVEAL